MKRLAYIALLAGMIAQNTPAMAAQAPCKKHTYSRATQVGAAMAKCFTGISTLTFGTMATLVTGKEVSELLLDSYQRGPRAYMDPLQVSLMTGYTVTAIAAILGTGAYLVYGAYKNARNALNYRTYLQKKLASCQNQGCVVQNQQ